MASINLKYGGGRDAFSQRLRYRYAVYEHKLIFNLKNEIDMIFLEGQEFTPSLL